MNIGRISKALVCVACLQASPAIMPAETSGAELAPNYIVLEYNFVGLGVGYSRFFTKYWGLGVSGRVGALPALNTRLSLPVETSSLAFFTICRAIPDWEFVLGYAFGGIKDNFSINLLHAGAKDQAQGFDAAFLDIYYKIGAIRIGPKFYVGQLHIYGDNSPRNEIFFAIEGLRITQIIDW